MLLKLWNNMLFCYFMCKKLNQTSHEIWQLCKRTLDHKHYYKSDVEFRLNIFYELLSYHQNIAVKPLHASQEIMVFVVWPQKPINLYIQAYFARYAEATWITI